MGGLNIGSECVRFCRRVGTLVHPRLYRHISVPAARSLDIHVSGGEYNVASNT
jgi:hypothetical protein